MVQKERKLSPRSIYLEKSNHMTLCMSIQQHCVTLKKREILLKEALVRNEPYGKEETAAYKTTLWCVSHFPRYIWKNEARLQQINQAVL